MKLDTGIYAKVIADSIANDIRITTLELRYPRFIHSEFMTHRKFSRNSSSSRAIPIDTMINQVFGDPAKPVEWGKNQKGMQAEDTVPDHIHPSCNYVWTTAAREATKMAKKLQDLGLHKQIVNRVLEPFQFITTVVTATEWENFFQLRLHPDADPTFQELARCMHKALISSNPQNFPDNDCWHLPYVTADDWSKAPLHDLISASVARCARISYLNHDSTSPDIEKDIELAERLLKAGHMSPFEHQARPMKVASNAGGIAENWDDGITHQDKYYGMWSANFNSWIQYRQLL